jgi:ubiquitin carboxyl-terminal hydrolase 14
MLLMMGTADELPQEPVQKTVFMEDMTDQQLASAVCYFMFVMI